MKKTVSAILLSVFLVFTLSACSGQSTIASPASTGSSSAKPSATTAPSAAAQSADKSKALIGKTYTAGTLQYTITYTRALAKGRMTPATGNYLFIVGVDIKNTAASSFKTAYSYPIATGQFSFKDSAGKSYNVIAGTGDTSGRYEALNEIEAGKTVSGELMYEVPESASKLYLTISDDKGKDADKIELSAAKP